MENKFAVQVKSYLEKENNKVADDTLKILNDGNKVFAADMLLAFQNRDMDKIAEKLEKERVLRSAITEWVQAQEYDEQVSVCLGGYMNTWNLFNKILQIEDERNRTSVRMMHTIGRKSVEKKLLLYVYDHPQARCADVVKCTGVSKYRVSKIMDKLADNYIVYKVNMGSKTFYDLTESAKRWLDEHIVSWRISPNLYLDAKMIDRYQDKNAVTANVIYKSPKTSTLFTKQFDLGKTNKNDLFQRMVEGIEYEYGAIQGKFAGVK